MRLINADVMRDEWLYESGTFEPNDVLDSIDCQPTVDAVPVVRCRDCKWWDKVDNIDGVNYGTCERKCTAIRKDAFPNENWFCADGERKDAKIAK